jgi:hypothetical protein
MNDIFLSLIFLSAPFRALSLMHLDEVRIL